MCFFTEVPHDETDNRHRVNNDSPERIDMPGLQQAVDVQTCTTCRIRTIPYRQSGDTLFQ